MVYIPVLSSPAGSCLTKANWQSAGVDTIALYLDELLMKPGLDILQQFGNLRTFMGWDKKIVLNCTFAGAVKNDIYSFCSRYDGTKINLPIETFYQLINNLKPDYVLLPARSDYYFQQYWQHLNNKTSVFYEANDDVPTSCLRYLHYSSVQSFTKYLSLLALLPANSYIYGDFNVHQLKSLIAKAHFLIESDRPAADGYNGHAYSVEDVVNLSDTACSHQFFEINEDCPCSTCQQKLSRAYLHHIIQHTPLLGQRLVIQHNVTDLLRA